MKTKRPIDEVLPVANMLLEALLPYCQKIELAGSLRRKKPLVGDIEILCLPKKIQRLVKPQLSLFEPPEYASYNDPGIMELLRQYQIIRGDLDGAAAKQISFIGPEDIQVDVFTTNPDNYGYIKLLRTGSHDYNTKYFIPSMKKAGYSLDDGFIWRNGKMIPVPSELDVYRLLGKEVVDLPENRSI